MRYVIDTHVFLWLLFEPDRLASRSADILADPKNDLIVASISFFEIALKYGLGKLHLSGVKPDELPALAAKMDIAIETLAPETLATFYRLPKIEGHKDPFDRMIVWHCLQTGAVLVSADGKLEPYKAMGLKVLKT